MASNPIHIASEETLLTLMRSQDRRAVSVLYDTYAATLFGVIHRIVKEEELAEDLLQEAFVQVWSSFEAYDAAKGSLFTWMLRVARNLALDQIRSKQYRTGGKRREKDAGATRYSPASEGFRPEHIKLKEITGKLSEEQRLLIDGMYFGGYTIAGLAQELQVPTETVKTRARSAIKHLSNLLKERE